MSVVSGQRSVLRGAGSTPEHALLGAHAGSFLALQREYLWITGVHVAPPQVVMQLAGEHNVVRVVRVVQHELAQRAEVCLDRVRPRAVGRREAQLDVVALRPRPDLLALVRGQVVEDHVDHLTIGARSSDRLQRLERVAR